MVRVVQRSAFKPGRYRVGGRVYEFTPEKLKSYAEGTNKAIKAGIPIPALVKHAPPGADDQETAQFAATDGAGWLQGVNWNADGRIDLELDVPEEIKRKIDDGTLKFTSPEFRPHYESKAEGVDYAGPLMRHIAFTLAPRNPTQGHFETADALAMSDSDLIIQCSADDYEGPLAMADEADEKKKKPFGENGGENSDAGSDGEGGGNSDGGQVEVIDTAGADDAAKAENPDAPPKATDKTKLAAFVEGMAQLGVILPSTFDFSDEGHAIDLLITAVNTKIQAEQSAEEANREDETEMPEVNESQGDGMMFSESDLAAMTPDARKKAEAVNLQFAEQARELRESKVASARDEAIREIRKSNLPPAVKNELLSGLDSVQFSEGGEPPTLTYQQVAKLVEKAMPPAWMQFNEKDVSEAEHADGDQFFEGDKETPEQAEKRARQIFQRNKVAV